MESQFQFFSLQNVWYHWFHYFWYGSWSLVDLSVKKPEKQKAQLYCWVNLNRSLKVFGSVIICQLRGQAGPEDYIMRIIHLSNDVGVGFPHQFLLIAGWPVRVRGLWLSELVLAVYSTQELLLELIWSSYWYLLRRFSNMCVCFLKSSC